MPFNRSVTPSAPRAPSEQANPGNTAPSEQANPGNTAPSEQANPGDTAPINEQNKVSEIQPTLLDLKASETKPATLSASQQINANTAIYIAVLDMDIRIVNSFETNNVTGERPNLKFALDFETAKEYGNKLVEYARKNGYIRSILNPVNQNMITSYPVLGFLILKATFKSEPVIQNLDEKFKTDIANLEKDNITSYHISSYNIPNNSDTRYMLHQNSYSILDLLEVQLIRLNFEPPQNNSILDHFAFASYNSLIASWRMTLDDVSLIKEIIVNGDGKSYNVTKFLADHRYLPEQKYDSDPDAAQDLLRQAEQSDGSDQELEEPDYNQRDMLNRVVLQRRPSRIIAISAKSDNPRCMKNIFNPKYIALKKLYMAAQKKKQDSSWF
jgi:hypothetical protein